MFELIDQIQMMVPGAMLVFARLSGMMATLPIFSYPMVPGRLRVLMSLLFTAIVFPGLTLEAALPTDFVMLGMAVLREVLVGMLIGFGTKVIFEAFNMAGSFVGRQMGIAVANVMDPTSQQQMPIVSQFWLLVVVTFFMVINAHHLFIETLVRNFTVLPVGAGIFSDRVGETILGSGSKAFQIALQYSAPAMVFLLLVDTAIAFTARIMPQMNIFMVTLPLKIGTGIIVLMVSLDIFQLIFDSIYMDLRQYIEAIIHGLSGGRHG